MSKKKKAVKKISKDLSRIEPKQVLQLKNESSPQQRAITIVTNDGQNQVLMMKELTGTGSKFLGTDIIERAAYAIPGVKKRQSELLVEVLKELKPKDLVDSMLCTQFAVLHFQGMEMMGSSINQDFVPHSEFQLKNATKLLRLSQETLEARMRYQRGGEQKVVVQHVNVNDGGQAIVGSTLVQGVGENIKNGEVSS